MSENGKMRSVARLLTETQSRANGPLSGKKSASFDVSEEGREKHAECCGEQRHRCMGETGRWGRGCVCENNTTEQSFPQHHRLTNQPLCYTELHGSEETL